MTEELSVLQASKNFEVAVNWVLTKAVIILKNKCMLIQLFYLNRLCSKLFDRPVYALHALQSNQRKTSVTDTVLSCSEQCNNLHNVYITST